MISSTPAEGALVVGASGGIGAAVLNKLLELESLAVVVAVSRLGRPASLDSHGDRLWWIDSDYSEESIASITGSIGSADIALRRVVICNGILHQAQLQPEKALEKLRAQSMTKVFEINTVVPALWVSGLVGSLRRSSNCVIAVLSARVGSIADNRLGGWYSYRASKAALNMFLKTAAVEFARRAPKVKLVAFHPGTTDTPLSSPFQKGVLAEKLFTPEFVAERIVRVMDEVPSDGELSFLAWDGKPVPW
jgi:NAD(P)-dependent dehydrogenase (short-subunit alcohol dehydrogenase family)